jgi:hypothetical protein
LAEAAKSLVDLHFRSPVFSAIAQPLFKSPRRRSAFLQVVKKPEPAGPPPAPFRLLRFLFKIPFSF